MWKQKLTIPQWEAFLDIKILVKCPHKKYTTKDLIEDYINKRYTIKEFLEITEQSHIEVVLRVGTCGRIECARESVKDEN